MTSPELDRLESIGALKREAPVPDELNGLIRSGSARLKDAQNEHLSIESRFDLAYSAAHAFALAALRWHGYRAEKRYIVFQALAHTLGTPASIWRLLAKCHEERNRTEYEGVDEIDETLVGNLIDAAEIVRAGVVGLGLNGKIPGEA